MYYECSLQSLNQLCTVHLEMSGAPSASVINWQNIYLDLLNRNNGNIFLDDINIEDTRTTTSLARCLLLVLTLCWATALAGVI